MRWNGKRKKNSKSIIYAVSYFCTRKQLQMTASKIIQVPSEVAKEAKKSKAQAGSNSRGLIEFIDQTRTISR